jgi:hypothetical protein
MHIVRAFRVFRGKDVLVFPSRAFASLAVKIAFSNSWPSGMARQ